MFSKLCVTAAFCVAMVGAAPQLRLAIRLVTASGDKAVLQAADITYLGALRVPTSGTDGSFTAGSVTGRVVAGHQHLFFLGNKNTYPSAQLFEIDVHGLTPNPDISIAPNAALVGSWGQFDNGEGLKINEAGVEEPGVRAPAQGLLYNEDNNYIYMGYNIGYVGTARYSVIAKRLDVAATPSTEGVSTVCGPFAYEYTDPNIGTAGTRTYNLTKHPTTGKMLGSSAYKSGDQNLPNGPSLIGGNDWPTCPGGGTGASNILAPYVYLNYYFNQTAFSAYGSPLTTIKAFEFTGGLTYAFERTYQNSLRVDPALNSGRGTWSGDTDAQGQAVWIEGTNKHGLIVPAVVAAGIGNNPANCSASIATGTVHKWYRTEGNMEIVLSSATSITAGMGITGGTSGATGTVTLSGLSSPDANMIFASQPGDPPHTDFSVGETLTFTGGITRTVVSFHRLDSCQHFCVPTSEWAYSTGPSFNFLSPLMIIFDPDRLETNAAGTTTDYTTTASSVIQLMDEYDLPLTAPAHGIAGGYYNPDTRRLYLAGSEDCWTAGNPSTCDFRQINFFVFEVDDSDPAPLPQPTFPYIHFAAGSAIMAIGSLVRRRVA